MKKIYFVPATEVVALNTQHMLANSDPKVSIDTSSSGTNPNEFETRRQNNGFGSGLWEDMK